MSEKASNGTSGQSVPKSPKSKFRHKSQQEQAAQSKLRMEKRGEKLDKAKEKLAKQKPPKPPGPVERAGRAAGGSVHAFVHGKIYEVEHENVGTEGAHRSELVGESVLRHGKRLVKKGHPGAPGKSSPQGRVQAYQGYGGLSLSAGALWSIPSWDKAALSRYLQKRRINSSMRNRRGRPPSKGPRPLRKRLSATEKLAARTAGLCQAASRGRNYCAGLLFCCFSAPVLRFFDGDAGQRSWRGRWRPAPMYPRMPICWESKLPTVPWRTSCGSILPATKEPTAMTNTTFDLDEIEHDPYVLLSMLSRMPRRGVDGG